MLMTREEVTRASTRVTENWEHYRVQHLPYSGADNAWMHIILPRDPEADICSLLRKMTHQMIKWVCDPDTGKDANFYKVVLPKCASEKKTELSDALASMMSGKTEGRTAQVKQMCVLNVNEEGTQAAAVTLGIECNGASNELCFVAFVWVITARDCRRNQLGKFVRTVLFMGTLTDPTLTE